MSVFRLTFVQIVCTGERTSDIQTYTHTFMFHRCSTQLISSETNMRNDECMKPLRHYLFISGLQPAACREKNETSMCVIDIFSE